MNEARSKESHYYIEIGENEEEKIIRSYLLNKAALSCDQVKKNAINTKIFARDSVSHRTFCFLM